MSAVWRERLKQLCAAFVGFVQGPFYPADTSLYELTNPHSMTARDEST